MGTLKNALVALGLSIPKAAEFMGLDSRMLQNVDNGYQPFPETKLPALMSLLKVDAGTAARIVGQIASKNIPNQEALFNPQNLPFDGASTHTSFNGIPNLGGTSLRTGGGAVVSSFDPTTLPLTFYFRNYAGTPPWTGTASAGGSGSVDLVNVAVDPTSGALLNGHTTAAFDGTQRLVTAVNINTLFGTGPGGKGSFWCVYKATVQPTAGGQNYDNGNIFCDSANATIDFGYTTDGLEMTMYEGAYLDVIAGDPGVGGWHLAQFYYDGADMFARYDSQLWQSLGAGVWIPVASGVASVGASYAAATWFTGEIAEMGGTDTDISTSFDLLKSYVNTRYALSL